MNSMPAPVTSAIRVLLELWAAAIVSGDDEIQRGIGSDWYPVRSVGILPVQQLLLIVNCVEQHVIGTPAFKEGGIQTKEKQISRGWLRPTSSTAWRH